jgi:hypothetical protein
MILLVSRCPVPGAAAGVGNQPGEALTDSVPHLCCLWCLNHQSLLELDMTVPWEKHRVDWMHKFWWWHKLQPIPQEPHLHLQGHVNEWVIPAAELCDHRGHSHILLCKIHSEGNSVWVQTQTSLQEQTWPPGGAQLTASTSSVPMAGADRHMNFHFWSSGFYPATSYQTSPCTVIVDISPVFF